MRRKHEETGKCEGQFCGLRSQKFLCQFEKEKSAIKWRRWTAWLPALKYSDRKIEGGVHRALVLLSHLPPPTSLVNFNAYSLNCLLLLSLCKGEWGVKERIVINITVKDILLLEITFFLTRSINLKKSFHY